MRLAYKDKEILSSAWVLNTCCDGDTILPIKCLFFFLFFLVKLFLPKITDVCLWEIIFFSKHHDRLRDFNKENKRTHKQIWNMGTSAFSSLWQRRRWHIRRESLVGVIVSCSLIGWWVENLARITLKAAPLTFSCMKSYRHNATSSPKKKKK